MKNFIFVLFITLSNALSLAYACPSDMVQINEFCIDQFEAPNKVGVQPFVARTALEGESWCKSQGKELCTDVQWQKACEDGKKTKYPYGNTYDHSACNDQKVWRVPNWRLVARYNPKDPDSWPESRDHIAYLNQATPSGSFSKCKTTIGIYDLTGNAAEWVRNTKGRRSSVGGNIYKHNIKGCYWSKCYKGVLPNCQFTNPNHASAFRSYETGFRCCLKL